MHTIRIRFCKTGPAAYISHLDLQRVFARGLRKSGLPVWYSQGFNPHIYMSFALPLPLGQQSLCEAVDCRVEEDAPDYAAYLQALQAGMPTGIYPYAVDLAGPGADMIESAAYMFVYPDGAALEKAVCGYNAAKQARVTRKTKRREEEVDLKKVLPELFVISADEAHACLETAGAGRVPDDGFGLRIPGDGAALQAVLPAGNVVNYNPGLLVALLEEQFLLPAGQIDVVRLRILTVDKQVF